MTKIGSIITDEEKLAMVETSLRNKRLKPELKLKLLKQHEALLKKLGRGQQQEQHQEPVASGPFPAHQQQFLSTLSGEDRAVWEEVFRIEAELRVQPQAQPKQTYATIFASRDRGGMTIEEIEAQDAAYLRLGPKPDSAPEPAIRLKVDVVSF